MNQAEHRQDIMTSFYVTNNSNSKLTNLQQSSSALVYDYFFVIMNRRVKALLMEVLLQHLKLRHCMIVMPEQSLRDQK